MFKNKNANMANLCGKKIRALRCKKQLSQREFAEAMETEGILLSKNAIQRIESGLRFVTDIELRAFAAYFRTTMDSLAEIEGDTEK